MHKIFIIGPSTERSKGGMATVIKSQLNSDPNNRGVHFQYLVSHVDGGKMEKLLYLLKGIFIFLVSRKVRLAHIHVAADASFYRKSIFVLLSRLKKVPVIMHVHAFDFDTFYNNSPSFAKSYIRSTLKSCKKVLVLSAYWYEFFCENIYDGNVEILHNGVDLSLFSRCKTTPDKLTSFLFLGRLGQRKGIYDLLEAINIVVTKRKNRDLKFYLAGDGDIEKVQAIIDEYKLNDNVFVLGWLDDTLKQDSLQKASTVILPSYNEGLPMSLLEAMACGKIIISTRVGGIPELVEEGNNGFLIEPGDINALVEHILYVHGNSNEMEKISSNNIVKVQNTYNLKEISNRLYNIYSNVILNY